MISDDATTFRVTTSSITAFSITIKNMTLSIVIKDTCSCCIKCANCTNAECHFFLLSCLVEFTLSVFYDERRVVYFYAECLNAECCDDECCYALCSFIYLRSILVLS
jgi:hypothetical protein